MYQNDWASDAPQQKIHWLSLNATAQDDGFGEWAESPEARDADVHAFITENLH